MVGWQSQMFQKESLCENALGYRDHAVVGGLREMACLNVFKGRLKTMLEWYVWWVDNVPLVYLEVLVFFAWILLGVRQVTYFCVCGMTVWKGYGDQKCMCLRYFQRPCPCSTRITFFCESKGEFGGNESCSTCLWFVDSLVHFACLCMRGTW